MLDARKTMLDVQKLMPDEQKTMLDEQKLMPDMQKMVLDVQKTMSDVVKMMLDAQKTIKIFAMSLKKRVFMVLIWFAMCSLHLSAQPPATPLKIGPLDSADLEALLGGPTRINLHLRNATPQEVIDKIAQQAGLKSSSNYPTQRSENNQPVSLNIDQLPFCEAVGLACQKLRRTMFPTPEGAFTLYAQDASYGSGRYAPVGNMVGIIINRTARSHSQRMADNETPKHQASYSVSGAVFLDPKVRLLHRYVSIRLTQADDEKGNDLRGSDVSRSFAYMQSANNLRWDFRYSPNMGHRLETVRGWVRFPVVLQSVPWEISDFKKPEQEKIVRAPDAVLTFRLEEVEQNQREMKFHFLVKSSVGKVAAIEAWRESPDGYDYFQLLNEKGEKITGPRMDLDKDKMLLTYYYPSNQTPTKLVMQLPTDVRTVEIPFKIKDLPLP